MTIVREREDRTASALKGVAARPGDPRAAYDAARVYAEVGDNDNALAWLGKALELGYDRVDYLSVDPAFTTLRKDPRFAKLLEDWRAGTGRSQ
jgi:TPR repeat protein